MTTDVAAGTVRAVSIGPDGQVTGQLAGGRPFSTIFAGDRSGEVTGQGVQDFFVATPGVAVTGPAVAGRAPAGTAPAAPSGGGLGY